MCIICIHEFNIDFILTYRDELDKKKKSKEDTDEKKEKRRQKRQQFLDSCVELGLEYEIQECTVSYTVYRLRICTCMYVQYAAALQYIALYCKQNIYNVEYFHVGIS